MSHPIRSRTRIYGSREGRRSGVSAGETAEASGLARTRLCDTSPVEKAFEGLGGR